MDISAAFTFYGKTWKICFLSNHFATPTYTHIHKMYTAELLSP